MNVQGLAVVWDGLEGVRERLRSAKKFCIHPATKSWCEPCRSNAVNNTIILLPALRRLQSSEDLKLPYLEPLQVEISQLFEKLGVPKDASEIYKEAVELKKLMGFVKRRATRKEVTKDPQKQRPQSFLTIHMGKSSIHNQGANLLLTSCWVSLFVFVKVNTSYVEIHCLLWFMVVVIARVLQDFPSIHPYPYPSLSLVFPF